ncbi:hypothetical protein FIBSPDRAFT_894022 [Athelia psychrophila]|uniref:Uncharacterized protein n=1 Tax=Athelia psychrophila TaxID=1759441 RepID=A0A166GFJ6_9AGAM|nr:hypothetical protein FIBSPDRAFT_894022 [Fibularhizoctonia sp. CBS 109695]
MTQGEVDMITAGDSAFRVKSQTKVKVELGPFSNKLDLMSVKATDEEGHMQLNNKFRGLGFYQTGLGRLNKGLTKIWTWAWTWELDLDSGSGTWVCRPGPGESDLDPGSGPGPEELDLDLDLDLRCWTWTLQTTQFGGSSMLRPSWEHGFPTPTMV